uniref:Ig-like domain-containing protein n=1 Tax=Knipowitschia caucasica TaxID=637954 RepID=A0AAV2KSE2_KNICA
MKPPAPRLTVTPDHFFKHKPVSLNCGSTGDWTVVRNTSTDSRQRCGPDWGRINGSVCEIEELYSDDNGLYWCERDGHRSAAVNITVHEQRVIEPSTSPPPAPSTLPTSPPASLPRHNPPPLGFSFQRAVAMATPPRVGVFRKSMMINPRIIEAPLGKPRLRGFSIPGPDFTYGVAGEIHKIDLAHQHLNRQYTCLLCVAKYHTLEPHFSQRQATCDPPSGRNLLN